MLAPTTFKNELFTFAFFPRYEESIKYLAVDLADREEWNFSDSTNKSYAILKNYLEFTFRRLQQEKKIAFDTKNTNACFNTGLVTSNLEEIFAYFETNRNPGTSPFCFKAFLKRSDNVLLRYFSGNLPDIANYFEKPELLIFNPKCELIPDIDHIIEDNISRFPAHLQTADKSDVRRQLNGAIDEVKKKVKTNYKIAVPQFYNSKIQLLLPLSLTASSPNPDLALIAQRVDDKTYTSRTCLTLKMAYTNARLIVKPQSNWLKP